MTLSIKKQLKIRWGFTALAGTAALWGGFAAVQTWWPGTLSVRWLAPAAAAMGYLLYILWDNLAENHRPGEDELLPALGAGNVLSILRGILLALFCGFLFVPRPDGVYAWVPGLLYTAASLPDYLDGYLARRTNHVTELGSVLDVSLDSVGVLAASLLAVLYGTVPWWYLPIGLARYMFLAGIWWRERQGKPVHELPYSHRRRGFAALKMGFMFVMLFPLFGPPGTYTAALAFGLPFAAAFLWDWFLVTGDLPPDAGDRFPGLKAFVLNFFPLVLRALALGLIIPHLLVHSKDPDLRTLFIFETLFTAMLALGILPRIGAIGAVIMLGFNQLMAPLDAGQTALIFIYIALLMLGSGRFSIWPAEEWLVYHRPGDTDAAY